MLVSTSIPLSFQQVPVRCRVEAIYATAINPFNHQPQRVHVLAVWLVNLLAQGGEPAYKVAHVRGLESNLVGYTVRVKTLKDISVFVTQGEE
jgi:hypothetical protein